MTDASESGSSANEEDEPKPDSLELLMAEALGQESELEEGELELLIAASEESGDLQPGEFEGLGRLADAFDSAGAMDEVARSEPSELEKKRAAEAWTQLVLGDPPGDTPGDPPAQEPPPAPGFDSGGTILPWWQRRPMGIAAAIAALLLAAFVGSRLADSGGTSPGDTPGNGGTSGQGSIPDGTLGADQEAPALEPILTRGDDGSWSVSLEDVQGEVRAALRELTIELEVRDANGAWAPQAGPVPRFELGSVHWRWDGQDAVDAGAIRFRIQRNAPPGRPGWRSVWFKGDQVRKGQ